MTKMLLLQKLLLRKATFWSLWPVFAWFKNDANLAHQQRHLCCRTYNLLIKSKKKCWYNTKFVLYQSCSLVTWSHKLSATITSKHIHSLNFARRVLLFCCQIKIFLNKTIFFNSFTSYYVSLSSKTYTEKSLNLLRFFLCLKFTALHNLG